MDKAERVALADKIMAGEVSVVNPVPAAGDTPQPVPSGDPAESQVTAPDGAKPDEAAGSDVSESTKDAAKVDVPAWVPESAREAWSATPALRDSVQAKINSIMADATEKWMGAAALKEEAKEAIDLLKTLRSDPAKWDAVQRIVTPQAEPADPLKATLAEQFGEDGAEAIVKVASQIADAKAAAAVHARVDGPAEHQRHIDAAAADLRARLGSRVTDEQFRAAKANVAVALGYTESTPYKPYEKLTVENVNDYLLTALMSVTQTQAKPVTSPPKPQAAKPASVKSSGMVSGSRPPKPWEAEGRRPTPKEQRQETLARNGITDDDMARWMKSL